MSQTGQKDQFSRGDKVVHPKRREWGTGTVEQTVVINHEGRPAQRVIVQFPNKGRVTINTAVSPLQRAGSSAFAAIASGAESGGGWLDSLQNRTRDISDLPESFSDPFASLEQRLEATVESFRYRDDARGLIDWAVAQTGLDDPLSEYTRSELEEAFKRFAHKRENHLVELVRQHKQAGREQRIRELASSAERSAWRDALKKALRQA